MKKITKTRTAKATKLPAPAPDKLRHLNVTAEKNETPDEIESRLAVTPGIQAGLTLTEFDKAMFQGISLEGLVKSLHTQVKAVNRGDLSNAEALLTVQAHTLDAIFNTLARRASANMGEYLGAAETYMRLALRAQSQARATIETLGELKNPTAVAFIRQANVAHGPQQVNNGQQPAEEPPRARGNESPQNKLLEQEHGERLDPGAARTTSAPNPPLETVGALHGPKNRGGKG